MSEPEQPRNPMPAPERVIGTLKDRLRRRGLVDQRLDRLVLPQMREGRKIGTDQAHDVYVEIGYASRTVRVRCYDIREQGDDARYTGPKPGLVVDITDEQQIGQRWLEIQRWLRETERRGE